MFFNTSVDTDRHSLQKKYQSIYVEKLLANILTLIRHIEHTKDFVSVFSTLNFKNES